jgi:TolA-binding protein
MKVVDLHPDDLLDKEARGELTEVERTRLEAHLARCETCRFERVVRDDFAEELFMAEEEDVPSQRLPPLVAPEPEKVERRISTRPARVRRNLRVALLVAAAVMIGSAATAGGVGGRVWAHVASALSLSDETTTLAPSPAEPVTTVATHAPSQKRVVAPEPTAFAVPETAPAVVPVALSSAPPSNETPTSTPASLFEAANKARNAGDYGRSITLHRRLEATFPQSREAHTSYATLGRLLLDRGDAMGALQAFDAYQAKGPGPLDEAVLVGRATALERLGRDAEARATWTQLLRDFPDTPYREHAESKLKKP